MAGCMLILKVQITDSGIKVTLVNSCYNNLSVLISQN